MKLRKTLVAGATATAIAFSATGIAAAEDLGVGDDSFSSSTSEDGEISPAIIKEYLDIILQIIRTLTTVMNLKV